MEEKIILRLRYIHREYVDIQVDDPDMCNILDIYINLLEGAEKKGMLLLEEPTLWYVHNSQNIKVENDVDLMKMFSLLHDKKLIHLSIGSDEAPCKNLELARILIESKKRDHSTSVATNDAHNPIPLRSSHASISLQSHHSDRKVPAITARRKELYVPKERSTSGTSGTQPTSGNLSVVLGGMNPNTEPNYGNVSVVNAVVPSNDELPCDAQVPFDASEDEKGELYFDDLYDNGEFYEESDVGKTELKKWMIFMNKEHMMDVLRDYCIQEGFSVVVIKSEQQRYTAECGDSKCEWRIHSSTLADGVTWAIKTLKGTHTCLRLNLYNPMATPEWAATKILEDVRDNKNISGKDINAKLWKDIGIKLKSTSLYRARTLALAKIRGDEDMSYTNLPIYCEVLKMTNPGSKAHCVWKTVDGVYTNQRLEEMRTRHIQIKKFSPPFDGVYISSLSQSNIVFPR